MYTPPNAWNRRLNPLSGRQHQCIDIIVFMPRAFSWMNFPMEMKWNFITHPRIAMSSWKTQVKEDNTRIDDHLRDEHERHDGDDHRIQAPLTQCSRTSMTLQEQTILKSEGHCQRNENHPIGKRSIEHFRVTHVERSAARSREFFDIDAVLAIVRLAATAELEER